VLAAARPIAHGIFCPELRLLGYRAACLDKMGKVIIPNRDEDYDIMTVGYNYSSGIFAISDFFQVDMNQARVLADSTYIDVLTGWRPITDKLKNINPDVHSSWLYRKIKGAVMTTPNLIGGACLSKD
jgi:hypothetical protein